MKISKLPFSAILVALAPLSALAQLYSVVEIGPIPPIGNYAHALDNNARVVGDYNGESSLPYFYKNGALSFPGGLGGSLVNINGLNDQGDFVGQYNHNGNYHAFTSIGGAVTDLGAFGGTYFSAAYDINNAGDVVGFSTTDLNYTVPFLYSGGKMISIGSLAGGAGAATAISENGFITGYSSVANTFSHAFLYSSGNMTDLGALTNGSSYASDVNELGQVVGASAYKPGNTLDSHAFYYDGKGMIDLGTLGGSYSAATGINNAGTIVGVSGLLGGVSHAFLSNGNGLIDLNSRVDWTGSNIAYLDRAADINEFGQITGNAIDKQGKSVAFLLTPMAVPVPEPSTYGLLGAAGLVLLAGLRKRARTHSPVKTAFRSGEGS